MIIRNHILPVLLLLCLGSISCRGGQEPSAGIRQRLVTLSQADAVAFGQADATVYGVNGNGQCDFRAVTGGSYPALINWDLGLIERDSPVNLDSVPFSVMSHEIRAQHERGGLSTLSWHPRNPRGGDSWSVDSIDVVKLAVTEGTPENDSIRLWTSRAARFIKKTGVPVIFRPWHEMSGGWFWWGVPNTTPESYKKLWSITREIFDNEGVSDMVTWAYSPDRCATREQYLEAYPGDNLVDILGADIYHFNADKGTDDYLATCRNTLAIVDSLAKEKGKIPAFTETGCESIAVDKWYTSVLLPLLKEFPRLAYVCVWRNAIHTKNPGHFYVPFPGHPQAQDFIQFVSNPSIIISDGIKKY